jgi:hypothetical protein
MHQHGIQPGRKTRPNGCQSDSFMHLRDCACLHILGGREVGVRYSICTRPSWTRLAATTELHAQIQHGTHFHVLRI